MALLAVVVGLVAGLAAAAAVAVQPAKYASAATMAIDQPRAIAASGDAGVVAKLAALRTKYAGLVTTQIFATPIGQKLGLPAAYVRSQLYAQLPENSLLIVVGSETASADQAQALASAASSALTQYVADEQRAAGIPEANWFTIKEVTPAYPGVKVAPSRKKIAAAGGLAALLGFAATFAALSLRRREDD
jgi:capsular polysaccharide biosynthesis protein